MHRLKTPLTRLVSATAFTNLVLVVAEVKQMDNRNTNAIAKD